MIRRHCDVLTCDAHTSDVDPGAAWVRLRLVAYYDGVLPVWRDADACTPAHGIELLDEQGEGLIL